MPGPRRASCVLSAAPLPLAPAKAADIPFCRDGRFTPPACLQARNYRDWRCGALLSQFVNQPHNRASLSRDGSHFAHIRRSASCEVRSDRAAAISPAAQSKSPS